MSFSSFDDVVNKTTNLNKFYRFDWNKIVGAATLSNGRWYDFSLLNGTPIANPFSGTALTWQSTNESSGFGIPHGGNVSPDTKHIFNTSILTSASAPSQLMLVDLQGYWPGISLNSATTQNLSGTPTLRYTNGVGCFLYGVVTTAAGATAHNISVTYTNSASASKTVSNITMTPSAIASHLTHSGTSANNCGPFLVATSGDLGVSNVASVTMSAASGAGAMALCLARPLLTIPMTISLVSSEKDFISYAPSLPRVIDGACLVWLLFHSGATAVSASTSFYGHIDFAWG